MTTTKRQGTVLASGRFFSYCVCWENSSGERYFSDATNNATKAMRLARNAVDEGRNNVRVLVDLEDEV